MIETALFVFMTLLWIDLRSARKSRNAKPKQRRPLKMPSAPPLKEIEDIPSHIVSMAEAITWYFQVQNIKEWKLCGIQNRIDLPSKVYASVEPEEKEENFFFTLSKRTGYAPKKLFDIILEVMEDDVRSANISKEDRRRLKDEYFKKIAGAFSFESGSWAKNALKFLEKIYVEAMTLSYNNERISRELQEANEKLIKLTEENEQLRKFAEGVRAIFPDEQKEG